MSAVADQGLVPRIIPKPPDITYPFAIRSTMHFFTKDLWQRLTDSRGDWCSKRSALSIRWQTHVVLLCCVRINRVNQPIGPTNNRKDATATFAAVLTTTAVWVINPTAVWLTKQLVCRHVLQCMRTLSS